jgi:hypothetical protein
VRGRWRSSRRARGFASFQGSDRTYSSPRVYDDLRDWGERCGENRVARLMLQGQLRARPRRRRGRDVRLVRLDAPYRKKQFSEIRRP